MASREKLLSRNKVFVWKNSVKLQHCAGMVLKRITIPIHDWHSQGFLVWEASGERSQCCPQAQPMEVTTVSPRPVLSREGGQCSEERVGVKGWKQNDCFCRLPDQPHRGTRGTDALGTVINTRVWQGPLENTEVSYQQVGRRASEAKGTVGSFPYGGLTKTADSDLPLPKDRRRSLLHKPSSWNAWAPGLAKLECAAALGELLTSEDITENIAGATDKNYHWRD